jgi:hypothetical protein
MLFGFSFSLSRRLGSMMPMLECLSHVQIQDSLSHLCEFSSEFPIITIIFSDGFEKSSFNLELPLSTKLIRPISHVSGDLGPLKPLSNRISLVQKLDICDKDILLNSMRNQNFSHFDETNEHLSCLF